MINLFIRVFRVFGGLLSLVGVDRDLFFLILKLKLTLDQRRPISGVHTNPAKKTNRSLWITILVFALFGLLMGLGLLWIDSPLVALTVVNACVMTMLGLTLVADFTNVLVDTTDNTILLPRPVNDRTLFAVRAAHIISYLSLLSLALSSGTLVIGAFAYHPAFPLVYFVVLICLLFLVVFFVYLFYLIAMRFTDMERFRDLILYFQIAMTIFVFGGYQVMPRLMDMKEIHSLHIEDQWWIYLFPPVWFAAPLDLLQGYKGSWQIILCALSVGIPLICFFLVIRYLAPGFSRALVSLETSGPHRRVEGVWRKRRRRWKSKISKLWCKGVEERAAFILLWSLASRDRPFKLATYPMVAFVFLLMGVFLLKEEQGIGYALERMSHTKEHLFFLYFACWVGPLAIIQLRYNDFFEAAWIYYALPVEKPGAILSAGLKVILTRFSIPLFGFIALATLAVWGPSIIGDVFLVLCVLFLSSLLAASLFARRFPFSEKRTGQQASGQTGRSFVFLISLATAGGIHFGLTFVPWGVPGAILVSCLLVVFGFRTYRQLDWSSFRKD
jgi:hypothetical protein